MIEKKDISKLIIRPLLQEDYNQIVHLDSLMTGFPRNQYFKKKFSRILGQDAQLQLSLVAVIDKKVIGFIMGEANSGEYGIVESVASVDTLGLDPEYKRSGIGKMMLEDFCSVAEKAGIELMTTLVPEDWPEVIHFFKAFGFKTAVMKALDLNLNPTRKFEG